MTQRAGTLVIGYGNPGRADDGLGPAFIDRLEREVIPGVRTIGAFQLQVEHAAEMRDAALTVFVDASVVGPTCTLRRVEPEQTQSFSTHSVSPGQVLGLARQVFGWTGDAFVLAIRGEAFDQFCDTLSPGGAAALEAAAGVLFPMLRSGQIVETPGEETHTGPQRPGSTPCRATSL